MDELTRIKALAETDPQGAARKLALGLMRGDAAALKAGYSAESAAMTAADFLNIAQRDVERALTIDPGDRQELVAFLRYLEETDRDVDAVIYAVEKPGKWWREYADFLVSQEHGTLPTPTGVAGAAPRSASEGAAEDVPRMAVCGCGATAPGECAAAVEGYYQSLGQRSEEQLRELADGDGCEAAKVLLVQRQGAASDA